MQNVTATRLAKATEEIVSIADACLGGLRGRSALLVGPEKERQPFSHLLQQAGMKYLYEEDTPLRVDAVLSNVAAEIGEDILVMVYALAGTHGYTRITHRR